MLCAQLTELKAPLNGWAGNRFGRKVTIHDGQVAILASPTGLNTLSQSSFIHYYQYQNNEWQQLRCLRNSSNKFYDECFFDSSGVFWYTSDDKVFQTDDINNDASIFINDGASNHPTCIVGSDSVLAINSKTDYGTTYANYAVRIFEKASKSLIKVIKPNSYKNKQNYGVTEAISDRYLAVGSGREKQSGIATGGVYIYDVKNDWHLDTILFPSDLSNLKLFGTALVFDGDYLVIGSKGWDYLNGSVYLFKRNNTTWSQVSVVTSPVGSEHGDYFGQSLAAEGNRVFIGSPGCNKYGAKSGLVFEYHIENDDLVFKQEIISSDTFPGYQFGWDLDVNEKLVVGAINQENQRGSAYIFSFTQNKWTQEAKLQAEYTPHGLGKNVQINDSILVSSCIWEDMLISYHKVGNDWQQDEPIVDYSLPSNKSFGENFGLYGDELVTQLNDKVVMYKRNSTEKKWDFVSILQTSHINTHYAFTKNQLAFNDKDKIVIFEKANDQWSKKAVITKDMAPYSSNYFGRNFYLKGNMLFVMQHSDPTGADSLGTGAVYLFEKNDGVWGVTHTFFPEDGDTGDRFGQSISMYGELLAIGSPWRFPSGSVYLFQRESDSWTFVDKILPDDLFYGDSFGRDIAFRDSITLAISIPNTPNPISKGKVYIYRKGMNGWQKIQSIDANTAGNDYAGFGSSIASTANELAISSPYKNLPTGTGSIYIFSYQYLPVKNDNIFLSEDIGVYPNPSKGLLNVDDAYNGTKWMVVNQMGQILRQGKMFQNKIDISGISDGFYVLILEAPDNQIFREKIIITK